MPFSSGVLAATEVQSATRKKHPSIRQRGGQRTLLLLCHALQPLLWVRPAPELLLCRGLVAKDIPQAALYVRLGHALAHQLLFRHAHPHLC